MSDSTFARTIARPQFGLLALIQFMTFAGLVSGCVTWIGVAAAALLAGFYLSVASERGLLAIVSLIGASVAAGMTPFDSPEDLGVTRQAIVFLIATGAAGWMSRGRDLD